MSNRTKVFHSSITQVARGLTYLTGKMIITKFVPINTLRNDSFYARNCIIYFRTFHLILSITNESVSTLITRTIIL